MNEDDFKVTEEFASYVSKPEITDLDPTFLVKGSKNVLIDYAKRVRSRNGFTLFGAANTGGAGIKGSYEWDTSNGPQFPLRSYGQVIEFWWNNTWNTLKTGLSTPYLEFAKVWDNTEKIDILIWVLGEANFTKWSGGISKVRSSTASTLTKQGVITAQTTIAFNAGTPGTIAPTITDSANNFLNAGFAAGDTLHVTGSTANSRIFTIGSVTAGVITLIMQDILVTEAAGSSITLHNGSPTWATSRFLTTGTRAITYQGVSYTYTGGENTDTLTGLTAFPAVSLGDPVWQTPATINNSGDFSTNFEQDLVAVQLNQLIFASTNSQEVYGSSTDDYTDFALTDPRAPGDPFKVVMDNYATCIVPIDNVAQTTSSLMFGAGTSEFFQLTYQLSQDNTTELVRMIKLKTAVGSGLISKDAICPIKVSTAYISREPAMDTLENILRQGADATPISDPIKDDFDAYDFTDTHVVYFGRSIYAALPFEGIVLIYDLMRKLWQPPQTIPISRFAIIGDELYGHSAITNESYKLFVGTNDNGVFIPQKARFAYNNGGRRDRLKNMSQYWSDGYITANATLNMTMNLGFNGSVGQSMMQILGSDQAITLQQDGAPFGSEPFGAVPLGGATLSDVPGLPGTSATLLRFWQVDTMNIVDFVENYVEYDMTTLDGQFAIVAHGSNMWDAGTAPISHSK